MTVYSALNFFQLVVSDLHGISILGFSWVDEFLTALFFCLIAAYILDIYRH